MVTLKGIYNPKLHSTLDLYFILLLREEARSVGHHMKCIPEILIKKFLTFTLAVSVVSSLAAIILLHSIYALMRFSKVVVLKNASPPFLLLQLL